MKLVVKVAHPTHATVAIEGKEGPDDLHYAIPVEGSAVGDVIEATFTPVVEEVKEEKDTKTKKAGGK